MPTLRENTAYWADRIWRKHQGAIKHLTKCVLLLFAIALILEAFVFNYNYFATRDYQPINLKYKIGLPVIGKIITPYVFTGPSFAFLTSRKAINEAWKNKSTSVAWNFGFGVQLLGHLQVGASYGIGMTKAFEKIGAVEGVDIQGKNRYWTVTAAYLF